jgi:hypothetical protein
MVTRVACITAGYDTYSGPKKSLRGFQVCAKVEYHYPNPGPARVSGPPRVHPGLRRHHPGSSVVCVECLF